MTDNQQLLAECAVADSETAFRELVTRYLNLVYSAAIRLMDGDTHLAEDIAQIVFTDLARRSPTLSTRNDAVLLVQPQLWLRRLPAKQ